MSGDFPYQEIRSLLLEYLAENFESQYVFAVKGVVELAKKHGLYSGPTNSITRIGGPSYDLDGQDFKRVPEIVRQLFWMLLVQGILVFGHDDMNPNWPFYKITEYGESILKQHGPRPYDPDGFLKEFSRINPNADSIVLEYLKEAVYTFNMGCFKASAVMLGCASEQIILILHEIFESAISDPSKKKAFTQSSRWNIYSKFNNLRESLEDMIKAKQLPADLVEVVRSDLISGFELIRRIRNSAGHPDIQSCIRREAIYLNLTFFTEYTRQVLKLVEYFKGHSNRPIGGV